MRFIALSLLLFTSPGLATAQTTVASVHWLSPGLSDDISSSAVTRAGGPVVSFPCDPLMSVKQERSLTGLSLSQMAADLSEQVPVFLDQRALDEIGIDPDSPIGAGVMTHEHASTRQRDSERAKWWQQDETAVMEGRPSLIVDVLNRVRDLHLTVMIVRGHVILTTVEAAEDDLATRIYDVTPLISIRPRASWDSVSRSNGIGETSPDFESLMDMIETSIDPETWERLGGNSTIISSTVRGRQWIVVSTTSMTHWKLQRLLDQLNQ